MTKNEKESKLINVTLEPTFAGSQPFQISISSHATVNELRALCTEFNIRLSRQIFVYKGTELSNDEATLSDYGINEDCTIRIVARMESGRQSASVAKEADRALRNMRRIILHIPFELPAPSHSMSNLRHSVQKLKSNKKSHSAISLIKEHEATRKRMNELMKRKNKTSLAKSPSSLSNQLKKIFSDNTTSDTTSDSTNTSNSNLSLSTVSTCNSICGSIFSPTKKEHQEISAIKKIEKNGSFTETLTRKDLFRFFDPPETRRELHFMRQNLYDPPQNLTELNIISENLKALCGVCKKRLPIAVRSIVCKCNKTFCRRHRYEHNCSVDYKQEERLKIEIENPKLDEHRRNKETK